MANSVIPSSKVYATGVAGGRDIQFSAVPGQLLFFSRNSVGISGYIAVDMVGGIVLFGNTNFMNAVSATVSNSIITVSNLSGAALEITVICP